MAAGAEAAGAVEGALEVVVEAAAVEALLLEHMVSDGLKSLNLPRSAASGLPKSEN